MWWLNWTLFKRLEESSRWRKKTTFLKWKFKWSIQHTHTRISAIILFCSQFSSSIQIGNWWRRKRGPRSIAHVRLFRRGCAYMKLVVSLCCWESLTGWKQTIKKRKRRKKVIDHFDNDEQLTQTHTWAELCWVHVKRRHARGNLF